MLSETFLSVKEIRAKLGNIDRSHDDSFASPVERIFIGTNGAEEGGCNNPQRQGRFCGRRDRASTKESTGAQQWLEGPTFSPTVRVR
jgi:hypothetical protein